MLHAKGRHTYRAVPDEVLAASFSNARADLVPPRILGTVLRSALTMHALPDHFALYALLNRPPADPGRQQGAGSSEGRKRRGGTE